MIEVNLTGLVIQGKGINVSNAHTWKLTPSLIAYVG